MHCGLLRGFCPVDAALADAVQRFVVWRTAYLCESKLVLTAVYVCHPWSHVLCRVCFVDDVQRAAWQSPGAAQGSLDLWLDVCRRLTRILSLLFESEAEVNTSDVARALVFQCSPALWSVLGSVHTLIAHVGESCTVCI